MHEISRDPGSGRAGCLGRMTVEGMRSFGVKVRTYRIVIWLFRGFLGEWLVDGILVRLEDTSKA